MNVKYVMKVIDIDHNDVSDTLYDYLRNNSQDYTSQVGSEHLFNVSNIENDKDDLLPADVVLLEKLISLAEEHDASYVRFIH